MNNNHIEKASSGRAEEDAQGNSCVQTVQPSVELNVCAASPEPAAALAFANLNSGTDCATTPDTTMNKSYTTKCSVARHKKPSFTITSSLARNSDNITFNYGHGIPSNATHVHPSIFRLCELTEPTTVSASGTVDDSVTIIGRSVITFAKKSPQGCPTP